MNSITRSAPESTLRRLPWLLAAAGLCSLPAFAQIPANTLPAGGIVSAGSAVISQAGAAMRIDQATPKAVIDWQSFSIGSNASVTFNQPSVSSITLNRVGPDGGRSIIDGRLNANGQVWLLNPGGVLVGATARIDVGGLLLSSQQLANDDFLNGNYRFTKGGDGSIVNQGRITAADGGYVALLAPEVRNEGVITARLGTVALASGDETRVDFSGDRLIEITVDRAAVNGLIENRNLVEAEGGWVLMSAGAAGDLAGAAINVSGVVRAASLTEHAGVIRLTGGDVSVSGKLDVSSAAARGGRIDVSGDHVQLTGAKVDASGAAGGGLVRIGGQFQGGKTPTLAADLQQSFVTRWNGAPALSNAATTSIDAGTHIDVSSGGGTAGTAIVWSGQETTFLGAIDASGVGPGVGNGGSVEISSAGNYGQVSLTGISGARSVLLDPKDIIISSAASGTGSTLSASDIQAMLSLGSSLTLLASNDLTWLSGNDINVNNASGDGGAVRLQAGRSIFLNSSIVTDNGSFSATANETAANGVVSTERNPGAANITMASGTSIDAGAGAVTLTVRNAAQTGRTTGFDTAGDITLSNVSAGSLTAYTTGTLATRSGSQITVTPGATVSVALLQADQMDLQGAVDSDYVALNVATTGRDIRLSDGLSGPPAAGSNTGLDIDQDEFSRISGGALRIWLGGNSQGGFYPGSDGVSSGNLTVAAPVTTDRALTLFGNNIAFDSALSTSSSLNIIASGNIGLNAPTSAKDIALSVGGNVTQATGAAVTADTFQASGAGSVSLGSASGGNAIAAVAADLTGGFFLVNSVSTTVTSIFGTNGITAYNIGIHTPGNLTLDAPLTVTGSGAVSVGSVTTTDPLCTSPCVRPHVELGAGGNFRNNVGASAITVPTGKFWSLATYQPATTSLNGLTPNAVSYDADSISGDILLSANRVFFSRTDSTTPQQPTEPTAPTAPTESQPTAAAQTSVAASTETVVSEQTSSPDSPTGTTAPPPVAATEPTGGTGSGGATMDNFIAPAPAKTETAAAATGPVQELPPPPPKLIVDASKSVPKSAGVLSRAELHAMNQQVHEARTQLFSDALAQLARDPRAADIPDCGNGGGEMCIAKATVKVEEGYVPVVKRKIALLIGNNTYRSPIPALDTPIGDVTDIGVQLRDMLGYEVKVIQNAGRGEIVDALNDLIKNTERDDSVMVMYAGHGYLQESTKTGYWIPTDATTSSPDKWISNDTIARALGNIPAKQVMLVSDSCYSGSLTKEGKAIETVGVNRDQALTRRSVLAMSSGGEEPVSDEGRDNHSIFAWNMIQSIKQMTSETSGQQLHARIKAAVAKDEFPQVPQYGTVVSAGHTEGGEYLLTPKKN